MPTCLQGRVRIPLSNRISDGLIIRYGQSRKGTP